MKLLKTFLIVCILAMQANCLLAQNKNTSQNPYENQGINIQDNPVVRVRLTPCNEAIKNSWMLNPRIEPENSPYAVSDIDFVLSESGLIRIEKIERKDKTEYQLKVIRRPANKPQVTVIAYIDGIKVGQQTYNIAKADNARGQIKVKPDTVLFQSEYEEIIQDNQMLGRKIVELKKQIGKLKGQITELEGLDVDKFLNVQDTTIFGSKYLEMTLEEIPERSRDFYLLVQNIHDLNILLTEIASMNFSQLISVRNKLAEASQKIDVINSFATLEERKITDYLTEEQKQFFRDLVDRYNELNGSINRDWGK